ncbi:MAG: CHAT domain-containing protein, partial [Candidatus Eisenbacteria bacterium]
AVLSGCETARGELIASEGVGGLRRAFRTAGAGAIVASLWSVRDDDAALWMERFYLDHLKEHRSTAEAARAASLALREHLLAAGEEPRVARWAAFLAVGD